MPNFAANLHYLFTEVPFLERFAAAAAVGFKAAEFQVPYEWPPERLAEHLQRNALQMVLFDAPMGNWHAGDRGLAAVPGREEEFRASMEPTLRYASALKCDTVHIMAGVLADEARRAEAEHVYVDNLRYAAAVLGEAGVTAVIEPINKSFGVVQGGAAYTTQGMHGYFLNYSHQARAVIERVAHPNLRLHLDCYHMQILEGNLARTLRENFALLHHVQIAGVPGRHEPDVGEINYPFLFGLLDELGYRGWVGCEYRPRGTSIAGLGWARHYGIGAQSDKIGRG
jgi:hydroxypyruvate isomerase